GSVFHDDLLPRIRFCLPAARPSHGAEPGMEFPVEGRARADNVSVGRTGSLKEPKPTRGSACRLSHSDHIPSAARSFIPPVAPPMAAWPCPAPWRPGAPLGVEKGESRGSDEERDTRVIRKTLGSLFLGLTLCAGVAHAAKPVMVMIGSTPCFYIR